MRPPEAFDFFRAADLVLAEPDFSSGDPKIIFRPGRSSLAADPNDSPQLTPDQSAHFALG
jgi:hypothetical protein